MFNFSFDKRIVYVIIAIMVLSTITQYITNPSALFMLLVSVPGVLIAITFHEFAHGYVAYKLGDNTAKLEGRLSLNPLDHLDPIGTLMLLLAGFGWGKPVNVNPSNYTRKISMEKGEALVSLAGPLMNIILSIIFAIIYFAIYKFANVTFLSSTVGTVLMLLISATISINVGLGIFNLIPLPPLDGSKILKNFLPYKAKAWMESNEYLFYILFLVLWVLGILGNIISPLISLVTNLLFSGIGSLFGF